MVTANVWGKVLGINGKPISDARVEFTQTDSSSRNDMIWSLTTNSMGQFFAPVNRAPNFWSQGLSSSESALKDYILMSFNVLKQGRKHQGNIEHGLSDGPIEIICPWIDPGNHESIVRYMCFGL